MLGFIACVRSVGSRRSCQPNLTRCRGYRRIPVLQDGADLWCDTRLIARELERRVPSLTLFQERTRGFADAIAWWAEHQFMRPVALFVSGSNADHMPTGLHEDRARLHGLPPPSIEAVRKAAIRNLHLVRPQIAWLADMLQDSGRFSWAARPASPISRPITVVWSSRAANRLPAGARPLSRLLAWRDRMAADRPRPADRHRP